MGKMREDVKEDRNNKHVFIEGLDEMSKEELKKTVEFKEYIRIRQAEIIKDLCERNDILSEELREMKKEE